jgi:hypothetical protein
MPATIWKPDRMNPWSDHADHGGDRQVSDSAYSVRYIGEPVTVTGWDVNRVSPSYRPGTSLYPVVTICWYVVEDDDRPDAYVVESDTEYDLVTDPNSPPGDTEVWSDGRYDKHGVCRSLAAADKWASELARTHSRSDITWDGRSLR